ncbi:MAG: metallophosphoesterase [Candidatus Sulfotelmatobacter sp.]
MASNSNPPMKRQTKRSVKDLDSNQRSAALAQWHKAAEAVAQPTYPPESMFSFAVWWEWVRNYLAYVLHKKHYFPPFTASPKHAVYDLYDEQGTQDVKVSIAGDWGTGTGEAESVANRIKEFRPHFTVHIGDVYYVGDPQSVNENCLGIKNPNNNYDPVTWPIGSVGSFALNGNHEMYANGGGYFDVWLPELGLCDAKGKMLGQQTSFFCLQNQYWRIIAIDTGYNSVGVPILSHIPIINDIPGIGGNCKLSDELIGWLTSIVKPAEDQRGLIIVSHHQNYSAFQNRYEKPAEQLWEAGIRRPVLWFWGHEHRLAGYDLYGTCGLQSFGRCIGHGGMPVDRGGPTHDPVPVFYDNRLAKNGYGVNGFVNLMFAGPRLSAEYADLDGTSVLREEWTVDERGAIRLVSIRKLITAPDFHA